MENKKLLDARMITVTVRKSGSFLSLSIHSERLPIRDLPKDYSYFDVPGQMTPLDDPDLHCIYFFPDERSADKFYDSFETSNISREYLEIYRKRKAEYFELVSPRVSEFLEDLLEDLL